MKQQTRVEGRSAFALLRRDEESRTETAKHCEPLARLSGRSRAKTDRRIPPWRDLDRQATKCMRNQKFNAMLSAAVLAFCCVGCVGPGLHKQNTTTMESRISVITLGVSDLNRSFHFYRDGLGFPTKMTPDGGIVLFATSGTRLFLYPYEKLAKDVGEPNQNDRSRDTFPGFTFGHCTRKREDVDAILAQAEKAGAKIVKPATTTSWGGYSGYFSDPDGYLWEVAYADQWKFNPDGSIVVEK